MRRFSKVAVGGTFDRLHPGHRRIISVAVKLGERVVIGVTTDEFVKRVGKRGVEPHERRVERVREFVRELGAEDRVEIVPLDDRYGITLDDPELEALVVSPETEPTAVEINEKRRERGLDPLAIIVVPFVLDRNGERISSTKLRESGDGHAGSGGE